MQGQHRGRTTDITCRLRLSTWIVQVMASNQSPNSTYKCKPRPTTPQKTRRICCSNLYRDMPRLTPQSKMHTNNSSSLSTDRARLTTPCSNAQNLLPDAFPKTSQGLQDHAKCKDSASPFHSQANACNTARKCIGTAPQAFPATRESLQCHIKMHSICGPNIVQGTPSFPKTRLGLQHFWRQARAYHTLQNA